MLGYSKYSTEFIYPGLALQIEWRNAKEHVIESK